MNLSIEFNKPVIKSGFDWQLSQEINVSSDGGQVVAKAEIELLTLNKHRDALASLEVLSADEDCDWTIPFNTYFHKQNISTEMCELLNVKADTKAKTHIMIEAISVLAEYRKQGIAQFLLKEIANKYPKAQSINVLSLPMQLFVDPEYCESEANKHYYQALNLVDETITSAQLNSFFASNGFIELAFDESELSEPLPYSILVASPNTILATDSA